MRQVHPIGMIFILLLLAWLAGSVSLSAAVPDPAQEQEIKVPFGFSWGESPDRLEKMLVQSKARIDAKREENGRQVIEATGIPQQMLRRALFYFQGGALEEIELHYGENSWDTTRYTQFFDQTRRHLDQRYGPGKLVARTRTTQGEISHSLVGYQWARSSGTLQIFLFTAEQGSQVSRILSLHYSGQ